MNNARSIYCIMSTIHGITSRSVKPAVRSDPIIYATVCVRGDKADVRTDGRESTEDRGAPLTKKKIKMETIPVISHSRAARTTRT